MVLLWLSYAIYSTTPFQNCLGAEEGKYSAAKHVEKYPPEGSFALIVNARNDTVCALHIAYEFRDAVTALATVFIALFTLTLWWSTSRLSKEAAQSRLLQIAATNAAGASANAANRSAQATERHLRAYLFVHSANISFDRGVIPQAEVRIANFGQTPAHDVRMWISLWIEEWPLKVELPTPDKDFPMASSVIAQGTEPVTMKTGRNTPIPPDALPFIGTAKGTIYVYGRIEYQDVFGERRWTNYRLIYGGSDGPNGDRLQPDTEGNSAN